MFCPSHCFPLIQEDVNGLALKAAGTHVICVVIDEITILSVYEKPRHIFHTSHCKISLSLSFSLAETFFKNVYDD